MQLHEHLVEQGIAGHGEPYFFLGGKNFGWGVTLQETSIAMENGPGLKMYVFPIENGGIFQPASAMLVYLVRVCFFCKNPLQDSPKHMAMVVQKRRKKRVKRFTVWLLEQFGAVWLNPFEQLKKGPRVV